MQYKEVETFLAVVRTRNITRTAELLYLSQSTVSNRLKSLEQEVGCQLIIRTRGHRTVQLTRQGEEFVPIAVKWKELLDETERLKSAARASLRIAANESTYYTWLAPFLQQFLSRHPGEKVMVRVCDSEYGYTLMERNQVEIGFVSFDSAREGVVVRCIDRQPLCVVCYCEHPGPEKLLHPKELDPTKEIRFTGGRFASMNAWHDRWFGIDRSSPLEVNTSQGIVPLIRGSEYWAICPLRVAHMLSREVPLQICLLEESPEEWQTYLLKRGPKKLDGSKRSAEFESEFLQYISQCLSCDAVTEAGQKGVHMLEIT